MAAVGLVEIKAAAQRIGSHVHRTPVLQSSALDLLSGKELYFKCENFQKTGSFKEWFKIIKNLKNLANCWNGKFKNLVATLPIMHWHKPRTNVMF